MAKQAVLHSDTKGLQVDFLVRLSNYRGIADGGAQLKLSSGFQAIVGRNNSGKSTILKSIYELRPVFRELQNIDYLLKCLLGDREIPLPVNASNSEIYTDINCSHNTRPAIFEIEPVFPENDPRPSIYVRLSRPREVESVSAELFLQSKRVVVSGFSESIATIDGGAQVDISIFTRIFSDLFNTIYMPPLRVIVGARSDCAAFDLHFGGSLIKKWDHFKSGPEKSQNERAIDVAHDIKRLVDAGHLEINTSSSKQYLQIIIDKKIYRLDEVGHGISQMIVALVNAALLKPTYIFIDEPEIGLHPTLQVDFLLTLAKYSRKGVLFSTHSLGLARSIASHIHVTHKSDSGHRLSMLQNSPSLVETLGSMQYSGSIDLGYQGILLVEGPSDACVVQLMLRAFDLDRKYVVLPLNGDASIHGNCGAQLREVCRLSGHVFALIDSEKESQDSSMPRNRIEFQACCEEAGIKCFVTQRRAIENYFSQRAIDAAFKSSKYSQLSEYQHTKEVEFWGKNSSWRIAEHLTMQELAKTDLGTLFKEMQAALPKDEAELAAEA